VLVLHQKYLCWFQHRWFEGRTEAGPRLVDGDRADGEHRPRPKTPAQSLQPLRLPSHLVQPQGDEGKPLFCQAVPLLTPTLMEGGKSFVYTGIGFLKENLRFPRWIHPADSKYQTARSANQPRSSTPRRTSNTTRDTALGHLLKYLPELRLRLLQNLGRTENCSRGGT